MNNCKDNLTYCSINELDLLALLIIQAPNEEIVLSAAHCSVELVLRIRFKYPPSLEKNNFNDVWDTGAFYYYFAQCRFDFIHDTLHDIYHCHIKVCDVELLAGLHCLNYLVPTLGCILPILNHLQ